MNFIKSKIYIFAVIFLAVISLSLYLKTVNNDFINLDDLSLIYDGKQRPYKLDFKSVKRYFSEGKLQLYHPLVNISFGIDAAISGGKATPYVFHATNVVLHVWNVLLVLLLFYLITKSMKTAFFVTLLFALFPTNVEDVAWVSARKDLLSSFFYMLGFIFYVLYARNGKYKIAPYCFSLLFTAAAMYSKPMVVTLPFMFILYDYAFKNEIKIKDKAAFFVLIGLFVLITIFARDFSLEELLMKNATGSLKAVFLQYSFYIVKFFLPLNLSYVYPSGVEAFPFYKTAAFFVYPLTVFALIWSFIKKRKAVFFGIMFFSISILPVLNIIRFGLGIPADRYTYIPYLGLFFCAVITVTKIIKITNSKLIEKSMYFAIFILFLVMAVYTNNRVLLWGDIETLSEYSVRKYTQINPIPQSMFVGELIRKGKYEEAQQYSLAFLEKDPLDADAYFNLAIINMHKGDYKEALRNINDAIRFNKQYEKTEILYFFRSKVYALGGNLTLAIENLDYLYAMKRDPGIFLIKAGIYEYYNMYAYAIQELQKFLSVYPTHRFAYNEKQRLEREFKEYVKYGYVKNKPATIKFFN